MPALKPCGKNGSLAPIELIPGQLRLANEPGQIAHLEEILRWSTKTGQIDTLKALLDAHPARNVGREDIQALILAYVGEAEARRGEIGLARERLMQLDMLMEGATMTSRQRGYVLLRKAVLLGLLGDDIDSLLGEARGLAQDIVGEWRAWFDLGKEVVIGEPIFLSSAFSLAGWIRELVQRREVRLALRIAETVVGDQDKRMLFDSEVMRSLVDQDDTDAVVDAIRLCPEWNSEVDALLRYALRQGHPEVVRAALSTLSETMEPQFQAPWWAALEESERAASCIERSSESRFAVTPVWALTVSWVLGKFDDEPDGFGALDIHDQKWSLRFLAELLPERARQGFVAERLQSLCDSNDIEACCAMGRLEADIGNGKEADRLFKKAEALAKENFAGVERDVAYMEIANRALEAGRPLTAFRTVKKRTKRSRGAAAMTPVAVAYAHAGDLSGARIVMDATVEPFADSYGERLSIISRVLWSYETTAHPIVA